VSESLKKRGVSAVSINVTSTLARRNSDLLSQDSGHDHETVDDLKQSGKWELFPTVIRDRMLKAERVLKSIMGSNELTKTASAPTELKPPYSLAALERVVRECPELARGIKAIQIGAGSRGFQLPRTGIAGQDNEVTAEHEDMEAFFKYICPDRSFSQVMQITVSSRKKFGFAAWEALRNKLGGYVVGINPIEDAKTVHWCLMDDEYTEVERQIPVGNRVEIITEHRRFRRYYQQKKRYLGWGKKTYFKEFGDPRHLDKNTGEYWKGPGEPPPSFPFATELLILACVDSGCEFPIPEWIPALPDALASRAIRICNLDVLDNGAVPNLAVIIEGAPESANYAEKIKTELKKVREDNERNRAIIIEVDNEIAGAGIDKSAVTPKVRIEPLSQLISTEGMFLKYLEFLEKSLSAILRLPLLLVGSVASTLNRATAEEAIRYAEEWVFGPECQDIDDVVNDTLLPEVSLFSNRRKGIKGVKYHRFKLGAMSADRVDTLLKLLTYGRSDLSMNEKRGIIDGLTGSQKIEQRKEPEANIPSGLLGKESGFLPLPEDSQITRGLKRDFSKSLKQNVKAIYIYEPDMDSADPYAA